MEDDTILGLLGFLTDSACPTFQREQFDVRVCYIDSHTNKVDMPDTVSEDLPDRNIVMLVIHTVSDTTGLHFSSVVINPKSKLVHAFDTLSRWPGECLHSFASILVCLYVNNIYYGIMRGGGHTTVLHAPPG